MGPILQVIDTLEIGGAESVFVDNVIRFQNILNYRVLLIRNVSKNNIDESKIKQINHIKYLNRKSKFSLLTAFKLHNYCKQFHIIHIHLRHTFRYVGWVKILFFGKYKLILHDHEGNIDQTFDKLPFFESSVLKPDFYIGVSQKLIDWSIIKWNIKPKQTKLFVNLPPLGFTIQEESEKKSNDRLIQVGNFKPIKNQSFTLDFVDLIKADIDFYGNIQDQDYYDYIVEKTSDKLSINYKLGVNINCELIRSYKFALCTSLSESGPMVLIEYLLSGVPFLSYKTGEISNSIYEFFPEFFMDNWNLNDWRDRYYEVVKINLNSKSNMEKIDKLVKKYFDSELYGMNLSHIYKSLYKN